MCVPRELEDVRLGVAYRDRACLPLHLRRGLEGTADPVVLEASGLDEDAGLE
jgi:hypothetical protein